METTFDEAKLLSYMNSDLVKYLRILPWPTCFLKAVPLFNKYFAKGDAKCYEVEDAVSAIEFASLRISAASLASAHFNESSKSEDDDSFCCIISRTIIESRYSVAAAVV
ncbi:hypothetical protein E4U61_007570 [Claviceps capensis]|nr:hypothetical protein E4U61_007570 [Claviceps capensis]